MYNRYTIPSLKVDSIFGTPCTKYRDFMIEGEVTHGGAAHLKLKKKKWSLVDKSPRKPRTIKENLTNWPIYCFNCFFLRINIIKSIYHVFLIQMKVCVYIKQSVKGVAYNFVANLDQEGCTLGKI